MKITIHHDLWNDRYCFRAIDKVFGEKRVVIIETDKEGYDLFNSEDESFRNFVEKLARKVMFEFSPWLLFEALWIKFKRLTGICGYYNTDD